MKTRELLNSGFLTYYYSALTNNSKVHKERKDLLTTTDLTILTNAYGMLNRQGNLYNLLFETSPFFLQFGKYTINSADLAAFTIMRYRHPPGDYWKPDRSGMYNDTAYGPGVPLPLLGARLKDNIIYDSWAFNSEDLDEVYKLDVLLGHSLRSTDIDIVTGERKWLSPYGLLRYRKYTDALFDLRIVREIREAHGKPLTSWNASKIKDEDIDNIKFFNQATTYMKHMFMQTWCWLGNCRSSNMILDHRDWDRVPKDIGTMSMEVLGHAPKGAILPPGVMKAMGLDYDELPEKIEKTYEEDDLSL